jgi:hypothetical protein
VEWGIGAQEGIGEKYLQGHQTLETLFREIQLASALFTFFSIPAMR